MLRVLTKSLAWQDQICQLLCADKKQIRNKSDIIEQQAPHIHVLSTSDNNNSQATAVKSKKKLILSPIRDRKM